MASRRWLVVLVVVGVYAAVLGGCSGAGGGGGSSTSVRVSSSVVSSSPVVVTSSGAVGDGRPAAARAHTQAGAEAFLRFFFDQLNVAWTKPDAHALDGLCLASSKACAAYRSAAKGLADASERYEEDPVVPNSVRYTGSETGALRFELVMRAKNLRVVDVTGKVVRSESQKATRIAAYLEWRDGGWIARDFKLVAP